MASQIAYAVAISIVGVSGATAYSIITQAGRIEHIQAALLKGKISIKLQAPKTNLMSSHHDLRSLLYMASHNLYSALQSIDSISGTVTADTSLSSLELQTTLHTILLKECRDDKRFPNSKTDPFQINIIYVGQVTNGAGMDLEPTINRRESVLVSSAPPPQQQCNYNSYVDNIDGNGVETTSLLLTRATRAKVAASMPRSLGGSKLSMMLQYVSSMPLSSPVIRPGAGHLLAALSDDSNKLTKDTKVVGVGKNLVLMDETIDWPTKQDLFNSLQFAQLAATQAIKVAGLDINTNGQIPWYNKYVEVLANIGWITASRDFESYSASGSTFSVDKVLLEIIASIATDTEAAFAADIIKRLQSSQSDAFTLWSHNNSDPNSAKFHVGVAHTQGDNGPTFFPACALHLESHQSNERFLWWSCSTSNSHLEYAAQNMALNTDMYGQVRATISKKLGTHACDYATNIDLGNGL